MVEVEKAAFKFTTYKIPSFSYRETKKEKTELKLSFNPSGRYFPEEGKFELSINFIGFEDSNEDDPIITINCIAEFKFSTKIEFDSIPEYFYTNSIAIAFPYLRAFVSTLTLQSNTGVIMLGLLNFVSMANILKTNSHVENIRAVE